MTRRRLLALLAAAAAAPVVARGQTETGLHAVGRAYLEQYPHEADETFLLRCLGNSLGGAAKVRAVVQREFEAGTTVVVRGFVLARTEARLAAHAALAGGAADGSR